MNAGKKETGITDADSKNVGKARHRKLLYWLIIDLLVGIILFLLLLYKPGRYDPNTSYFNDYKEGEVSRYLTHELSPQIHDGIQKREPFEITITQEGLNDIITRANWPVESGGVLLYKPSISLIPDLIVFMGTADIQGMEFIVTIEIKPTINEQGLMGLDVKTFSVGALNLTPIAKLLAKNMYTEKISSENIDQEDIRTKIVASLLNDETFDPVFSFNDKNTKIEQIVISEKKLVLHLLPL